MEQDHSILEIHRETLVGRLVQHLQESILSRKLKPGSRVSEVGVAKQFGVSRVPAREALQRLEDMNFIRRTHLGREIIQFSKKEFADIYELKNIVEAFGAMKGALRATSEDIDRLAALFVQMEEALGKNDIKRLQELNHSFHDGMVLCCNNAELIASFGSLAKRVRWAMPISMRVHERPALGYIEHKEIFTSFRNREAEKVRNLLETHSNENMKRILWVMESSGYESGKGEASR
ncbi:MAG: GntR family transcriptional regulator [Deltaproteobacteria bacterium]|nr:GntR family transcriptional regulator [Deltaproteobacteria bacterium]